jgi:uncharacterized protein (DUF58 family)
VKHEYLQPGALAKLGGIDLVARLVVEGFMTGLHKSPYQGFNVEFAEHRQYMLGDDIRHIDWRVYGKSDRHYVKKFEEETNLKATLLVDISRSMTYAGDGITKLDYARYLAASLTYLMLRQRDSVGVATAGGGITQYVPARGSPAHLRAVMDVLEQVTPEPDTRLGTALHELSTRLVRRGLIIVLSDLLDDPDEVLRALRLLRHRKHDVVVFHIMDEAELTFPFREPLVFRDVETGETLAAQPSQLRASYLDAIGEFQETYRAGCAAHGMDYRLMSTATPFDDALLAYLSRRKG